MNRQQFHWPRAMLPRRAVLAGGGLAALMPSRVLGASGGADPEPIPQPADPGPRAFMARAEAMRDLALAGGDQGFGAVIVKDGRIVGQAPSRVVTDHDPTAHAEVEAIRDAARRLGTHRLTGGVMYGTFRACPMCETAAYWARLERLYYGDAIADGGPPRYGGCAD